MFFLFSVLLFFIFSTSSISIVVCLWVVPGRYRKHHTCSWGNVVHVLVHHSFLWMFSYLQGKIKVRAHNGGCEWTIGHLQLQVSVQAIMGDLLCDNDLPWLHVLHRCIYRHWVWHGWVRGVWLGIVSASCVSRHYHTGAGFGWYMWFSCHVNLLQATMAKGGSVLYVVHYYYYQELSVMNF